MDDKLKPIAALIVDKITQHAYMFGAGNPDNWWTTRNENRYISVLERIATINYRKSMHDIGPKGRDSHPPLKGPEFYDHIMSLEWKEPIGRGCSYEDCIKGVHLPGPSGNWYYPCSFGFHITLWHPTKQEFQESIFNGNERLHWRPIYHFDSGEVDATLKIISKSLNWKYEKLPDGRYSYMF